MPRTKTFFNEIKHGLIFTLNYPKNLKELIWTIQFIIARLIIYINAFNDIKFKKKNYSDGWRKENIESTKPLD